MTTLEFLLAAFEESPNDEVTHAAIADAYLERGNAGDEEWAEVHRLCAARKVRFVYDGRKEWTRACWDVCVTPDLMPEHWCKVNVGYLEVLASWASDVNRTDHHEASAYREELSRLVGWGYQSCGMLSICLVDIRNDVLPLVTASAVIA